MPKGESAVPATLQQISDATRLAIQAEQAFRMADPAGLDLQIAAERAHFCVLQGICHLTEREADQIEPAFTELEARMLRTSAARSGAKTPGNRDQ